MALAASPSARLRLPGGASRLGRWVALRLGDRRRKRRSGSGVPNAPASLALVDDGVHINLTWQDQSSNETGFRLYRKVDAGSYSVYQALGAGVTSYQDSAVVSGKLYTYFVVAYNGAGESAPSNVVFDMFNAS